MPRDTSSTRGDDTRNQLLEAGLKLFAMYGYESVSTRQLTSESGANIAAINYHFGGKIGLYRAVLEQLVTDTEQFFGPNVGQIENMVKEASGDRVKLAHVVTGFVNSFCRVFLENDFMRWRAPLVMREYSNPSENFDIIYKGRIEPLHKAITSIAAAIMEKPVTDPECAIRAHTIIGQLVVFGIARVILWKRLEWESYTPERVSMVIKVATQSILNSLDLPEVKENSHVR